MSRSSSLESGELDGETYKKISASAIKAKFESHAADSEPPKRNFVINKGKSGDAAKKFNQGPSTSTKCMVCNKTVYPMEKLEIEGQLFHKMCLKCETCKRTLGLGNYAALQGKYYCKPHLKQLFQLKGNYDEGFGREQRKTDWVSKDGPPPKSTTPAESQQNQNTDPVVESSPDEQAPIENNLPDVDGTESEQSVNGHLNGSDSVEEATNVSEDATNVEEDENSEITADKNGDQNVEDDSENLSPSNGDMQNGEVNGDESGDDY